MKVALMGLQDMDFGSGRDRIDGVKLHYSFLEGSTFGHQVGSQFIARNIFDSFNVGVEMMKEILGTEINLEFNNKGKIVGLTV